MPRAAGSEVGGVTATARKEPRSWSLPLPTWMLLAALFALSFAFRFLWAVRDPAPWIFSDELNYWMPARSLGYTGHFSHRGIPGTAGFGFVYQTLIAPAFAPFDRPPRAYDAVKAINCLLMSATVFPVYLLARRYAGRGLALAAAALSVGIAAMTFTGNVMTENALYPLVACWALALVVALERPTAVRQILVVVLVGVAVVTKIQAIALVPAMVTAIAVVVLLDVLEPGRRGAFGRLARGLARFWPTWALFAVAVPALIVRQALRDQPLRELLGSYAGVTGRSYRIPDVAHWALYHLAALDIFVGFFPLAALLLLTIWAFRPAAPRDLRILAAVASATVFWFLVVVSAFATTPDVTRILERNIFHVEPLFFVVLVAWIALGAPRPWWAAVPAALVAGTLTLALPLNNFFNTIAYHSTPGLLPLWRWRDRAFSPASIDNVVAAAAIVAALLFVLVPRRWLGPVTIVLLAAYFAAASRPIEAYTHRASNDAYLTIRSPKDWIDGVVGTKPDVASLYWAGDQFRFWEAEFFNRSVAHVYSVPGPYDGLGVVDVSVEPSGLVRGAEGQPVRTKYLLSDEDTDYRAKLIAARPAVGMALYAIDGPVVVEGRSDGLFSDGWSGPDVYYTRYGCRGGRLVLRLSGNPIIHPAPVALTIEQGPDRRQVHVPRRAQRYPLTLSLHPQQGICLVRLSIETGSASVVTPGDLRELGLRFDSIRYEPPR